MSFEFKGLRKSDIFRKLLRNNLSVKTFEELSIPLHEEFSKSSLYPFDELRAAVAVLDFSHLADSQSDGLSS
ncbi:MAG: hypothetical protein IPK08_10895 [Bacteroidetes bacterium]|nr:hypothetical protein [Bacteroidota bacterium]